MGGQKALQTTNKQKTNEQTNTRNDHNRPPGFFQNPRANNTIICSLVLMFYTLQMLYTLLDQTTKELQDTIFKIGK